jgi:hypothetical protein
MGKQSRERNRTGKSIRINCGSFDDGKEVCIIGLGFNEIEVSI